MISIIIPCLNEQESLDKTLGSIEDSTNACEVIVVDDCSEIPLKLPSAISAKERHSSHRLIRNERRCGVSASRHIGALHARGDWLLFTDCHMVFKSDWHWKALNHLEYSSPRDLHCGSCAVYDGETASEPSGILGGATINFYGPDPNNPNSTQWLEAVWSHEKSPEKSTPVPCVMGASYFISTVEYMRIQPLNYLKLWGCEEIMLSLKTWMNGGAVYVMNDVIIGHVWRRTPRPWGFTPMHKWYNKLFVVHTLMPPIMAEKMLAVAPKEDPNFIKAQRMLYDEDWRFVEMERARNSTQVLRLTEFRWVIDRFGLNFPW